MNNSDQSENFAKAAAIAITKEQWSPQEQASCANQLMVRPLAMSDSDADQHSHVDYLSTAAPKQQISTMSASLTPKHISSAKMISVQHCNASSNNDFLYPSEDFNQSSMLSGDEYTFEQTAGGSYLSKKKMQYLEQKISDRTGSYCYAEDPSLYRKARKRLQNRESAVRSRLKKRQ